MFAGDDVLSVKDDDMLGGGRVFEGIALERIGNVLVLDRYKIAELRSQGSCSFISHMFYNKGLYRVRSEGRGVMADFAVSIDKVVAATYEGLVEEMGEDCVDKRLWKDVPEGDVIFFYSLHREDEFVKEEGEDYMVV